MDVARATRAVAPHVAPSLLKMMRPRRTLNIQLFQVNENIPIRFFAQNE
jgi:hypothetical protein